MLNMPVKTLFKSSALALVVASAGLLPAVAAQAADVEQRPITLDIKSQPIGDALNLLAQQSGLQIVLYSESAGGITSKPTVGEFPSNTAALDYLLADTGLVYRFINEQTVMVQAKTQSRDSGSGNSPERDATKGNMAIEEMIVTANKRAASIQDTAMSITALSSDVIDKRNLVGMGDYLSSLPGVSVLDQGPGFNSVIMRGITADPQVEGANSSPLSGVYFGETSISGLGVFGNSTDIKLVDMERIEVLRGPQGTLYGAGAIGGVVRMIPVAPNLEQFEGKLELGSSITGESGGTNSVVKGAVNIPLINDTLAIRAVAYRFNESGAYQNVSANDPVLSATAAATSAVVVNRDDVGNNSFSGGRISALWQPTDKLSISASYLTQNIEQDGWGQEDLEAGKWSQVRFQVKDSDGHLRNEGYEDDIEIVNLAIEYDLEWATLFSATSKVDEDSVKNVDLAFFFGQTYPWGQQVNYLGSVTAEELRLVSKFEGPLQFLLGLFYEERETGYEVFGLFGGTDPALNAFAPGEVLLNHNVLNRSISQRALFGELYYDLTEQVKLTVGGRVFKYDRENVLQTFAAPFGIDSLTKTEGDEGDVSLKAGVEYTPNDSTLIFATWSEGFRLGYPVPAQVNPACDQDNDGIIDGSSISTGARTIDSDFVENMELGGKFSLLDNQLTVNTALYQIDWEGIPISQVFDFCAAAINAGKARSRGAELEVAWYWSENLLLNFSTSYVDAELTTDVPQFNAVAGNRLPGSPRYNASLGVQYSFNLGGYDAYLRSDYAYVGGFYNNLQEIGTEVANYSRLNAKAGIVINQFEVGLYVNNLTNEDAFTWIDAEAGNPLAFDPHGNRLRPRTIGLNIGYQF